MVILLNVDDVNLGARRATCQCVFDASSIYLRYELLPFGRLLGHRRLPCNDVARSNIFDPEAVNCSLLSRQ